MDTDASSTFDALLAEAPDGAHDAVTITTLLPQSVKASSLGLGWWPLNVERRELAPNDLSLPGGTMEHLLFVTLAEGHYIRQDRGGFSDHLLEVGHVSIHPARRPVRWQWDTLISTVNLTLDPLFLDEQAKQVFGLDPSQVELMLIDRERDPVISNIATLMLRELMRADAGSALVARSLAHLLAVHLLRYYLRRSRAPSPEVASEWPRAVCAAVDFIDSAYAREISLADMAQAAHVSPFHLSRLFKRHMGMTPHQYLTRTRVESARDLLSAGSKSLAEVANAVGFADQSHLNRQFKRVLGMTPGQIQGA